MSNDAKDIRRQKFIEHYATNGNATAAALAAGYSKNGAERAGYRLLQNKAVQSEIKRIKKELSKKSGWTRERAIAELEDIEKLAKEDIRPNYSAAVKAVETIAKLTDLFPAEKKEIEISSLSPQITFEQLCKSKAGTDDNLSEQEARDTGSLGEGEE